MDLETNVFKIRCTKVPNDFFVNKALTKQHFRKFGKIKRMILKPKQRICICEYFDNASFLKALRKAGEYNGMVFKVVQDTSKPKKQIKDPDPDWPIDPDIQAELDAMAGTKNMRKQYNLRPEKMVVDEPQKRLTPSRKKATKSDKILDSTMEQLINLIKKPASTVEEKYRILDARDKLIRLHMKKASELKFKATVGTCPDMCPEKERLMRETQHQVALYEQEDGGRGMNENLAVKQYSRSSADQEMPLPHELRPVNVLKMTMGYLMHKIMNLCDSLDVNLAEWYHFLWDRTRGIRKDITQQELCCLGSVELVEQCARFHIHCSARLVAEDPSVFDQKINTENLTKCLQSLKYMYHDLELKNIQCPNEAEFRAYIILLNLNDGNFMWEVQQLRKEIQKSAQVRFALNVYSALDKNNYVKFFKLVNSTTYLNACILMRYFVQMRQSALNILSKCYSLRASKSFFPLNELTRILAFEDNDATRDFLEAHGLQINNENTHAILEKSMFCLPDYTYVLDRAINVVESKRNCLVGEVVCNGTPSTEYQMHKPQNSFDSNGYLILDEGLIVEEKEDNVNEDVLNEIQEEEVVEIEEKSEDIKVNEFENENSCPDEIDNVQPLKKPSNFLFERTSTETTETASNSSSISFDSSSFVGQQTANTTGGFVFNLPIMPEVKKPEPKVDETKKIDLILQQKEHEKQLKLEKERQKQLVLKKLEEEKRRLEKEHQERLLKQRKQAEEKLKSTVKTLLNELVIKVENKILNEKLMELKLKAEKRLTLKMIKRWRENILKRKRKRKAIDCGPIFASWKDLKQEANELHTNSQELTLNLRKRYKRGLPDEIISEKNYEIKKISIHQLVYNVLTKRLYELNSKLVKNIYWKINISFPNENEMENVNFVEQIMKNYLKWEERGVFIEHFKENAVQSATYCFCKQKGVHVKDVDFNGLIFIANDFNVNLQKRIFEHLKPLGVYVKIPIVVLLQHYDKESNDKLTELINQDIVSNFLILVDTFSNLTSLIDEGLMFLAKNVQKPPPLEMDSLKSLLSKCLGTELYRQMNSFTKWNSDYKNCLKKPNIVINLYNQGLKQVKNIILDKSYGEYENFPQIFQDFLPNSIPDFLPCSYRYFPSFWKNDEYLMKIETVLNKLELPQYGDNWPPIKEFDLELNLSKYCAKIFNKPEKAFYKIVAILLRNIDNETDFKAINQVLWTDVVEVLFNELLNDINFSLTGTKFENKSIFNQFIVVYDMFALKEYSDSNWFYVSNPIIKTEIENQTNFDEENKIVPSYNWNMNLDINLDETLSKLINQDHKSDRYNNAKNNLDEIKSLMTDLEESISIHKKVSHKFEDTLKDIIENC